MGGQNSKSPEGRALLTRFRQMDTDGEGDVDIRRMKALLQQMKNLHGIDDTELEKADEWFARCLESDDQAKKATTFILKNSHIKKTIESTGMSTTDLQLSCPGTTRKRYHRLEQSAIRVMQRAVLAEQKYEMLFRYYNRLKIPSYGTMIRRGSSRYHISTNSLNGNGEVAAGSDIIMMECPIAPQPIKDIACPRPSSVTLGHWNDDVDDMSSLINEVDKHKLRSTIDSQTSQSRDTSPYRERKTHTQDLNSGKPPFSPSKIYSPPPEEYSRDQLEKESFTGLRKPGTDRSSNDDDYYRGDRRSRDYGSNANFNSIIGNSEVRKRLEPQSHPLPYSFNNTKAPERIPLRSTDRSPIPAGRLTPTEQAINGGFGGRAPHRGNLSTAQASKIAAKRATGYIAARTPQPKRTIQTPRGYKETKASRLRRATGNILPKFRKTAILSAWVEELENEVNNRKTQRSKVKKTRQAAGRKQAAAARKNDIAIAGFSDWVKQSAAHPDYASHVSTTFGKTGKGYQLNEYQPDLVPTIPKIPLDGTQQPNQYQPGSILNSSFGSRPSSLNGRCNSLTTSFVLGAPKGVWMRGKKQDVGPRYVVTL